VTNRKGSENLDLHFLGKISVTNKIIFVNRFFYPDYSATSQMLSDLAFGLADKGMDVEVVSSSKAYQRRTALKSAGGRINDVRVHRVWAPPVRGSRLLTRGADYLIFYLLSFVKLLRILQRGDVVVAMTDPPMLDVVVGLAGWIKGAKTAHWMQDVFPEVAAELGFRSANGRLGKGLIRLRNTALRNSEVVVAIGNRMRSYLLFTGVDHERISVIPNWIDDAVLYNDDEAVKELRKRWGLEGKFVVGYSGNLGRAHTYDSILEAMQHFSDDRGVVFLWVGGGVLYEELKRKVSVLGLDNVIFKPYQDQKLLPASLRVPDCHVISLNRRLEGLIVPSKFYGVLAAGRPSIFIGDPQGELATEIRVANCGAVVDESDAEGLVDTINYLKNNPTCLEQQGKNARELFEERFTKGRAISQWYDLLRDIA